MATQDITIDTELGTISGIELRGGPGPRLPLLVCLPGGSYNARYFDIPGHSLLDAAHDQGFSIVALDRPGYGGSDPLVGEITFAKNAEVLAAAIAELWKRYEASSTGVVLIGHSMGGAIAIHIASRHHSWPLLGVSATAIHIDAPDQVIQAWNAAPAGAVIEFSTEQRLEFMYGPDGTFNPDVVDAARISVAPIPVDELLEVVGGWITDFPDLAAAVNVPVHYALAEHEKLWISNEDNVRDFGKAFTAASSVAVERVKGSGHNIDHHNGSHAFHRSQLAFARKAAQSAT